MLAFVAPFIVGIICVFLGISNMKGNISSLHSYHRHRVTEQDRIPFGKRVGIGTIIIGIGIMLMSVLSTLSLYFENQIYTLIGTVVLIVCLVVGITVSFHAMIKYNKGIF